MKELEVGMYIRYVPTLGGYTQKISKITKTKNCLLDMAYYLDNEKEPVFSSYFDYILKSSFNPIDLIEVGDYVNGYKVLEICTGNFELNNPLNVKALKLEFIKEDINPNIPFFKRYNFITNSEIKSIVTKEQFDSMKYVVGDKE